MTPFPFPSCLDVPQADREKQRMAAAAAASTFFIRSSFIFINVFILYLTSFLLGSNFQIEGIVLPFLIAIIISVLNMFMEGMIIKPIIHKGRVKDE